MPRPLIVHGGIMRGAAVSVVLVAVLAGALLPPSRAADLEPPTALDAPFSPNVRVNSGNPTYVYQVEPTMAINSQGRIFVGWKEAFTHNGGGQRVSFSYSPDMGATWAPNAFMPLHTYAMQSDPWLTVSENDRVFFSRIEYDGTSVPGGIAITETLDGVAWGPTRLMDDAPRFADKQTHANDAVGNVYMIWNSDLISSGLYQLYFSRSDDAGVTWTPKVLVPDTMNGHLGGFVEVHPNGNVFATWWSWANQNVWFDRSIDGGVSWGTDVRVNDIAGSADSPLNSDPPVLPAMAVAANGTTYVVWEDYRNARPGGTPNGNMDIMFSRSSDGGVTWSAARRLNDDATTARQWMPDLAIDPSGGIHVAWMDQRESTRHVYYVSSMDGGTTWAPNLRVTDAGTPFSFTRPGDYLDIESDSAGTIHVVWTDGRLGDLDIFYARLVATATVTVDTVPGGRTVEVDGVPRVAPYAYDCLIGQYYTLSAPTPQGGSPTRYTFSSWSDGGAQTHQFLCSVPTTYTATFLVEHEVTVSTSPPNLSVLLDGVSYVAPWTSWWPEDSSAVVDAPSPQGGASTRHLFDSWSDAGSRAHVVVASGPMALVATFRTQFFLLAQSSYGVVSCDSPDCWYDQDAPATFSVSPLIVNASPGTRYRFSGWLGDSNATSGSADIIMDGPHIVTAAWGTQHELRVDSPYGTTAGAGWYNAKSNATFSVSPLIVDGPPRTRYAFDGWTGDSNATAESATLVMDGTRSVTAMWGTEFELTVDSPHGSTTGSGWYRANTAVPFSVSPVLAAGPPGTRYVFQRWTGDSAATTADATIDLDAPRTATARWGPEYELTIVSAYGTPEGAGWHADGELVNVSIEAEVTVYGITYRFVGWTGDEVRSDSAFGTVMDRPKRIEAVWERVAVTPTGSGLPANDWLPWLILLAVILMLILLFAWRRRRKEEPLPPPPID